MDFLSSWLSMKCMISRDFIIYIFLDAQNAKWPKNDVDSAEIVLNTFFDGA